MTTRVDRALGAKYRMPDGYALMYNRDRLLFYWRKDDGTEGRAHHDKWHVWRDAANHAGIQAISLATRADKTVLK